ncbi:hypothetical protein T492DRAFT_847156 [Pavlovales sp. CCMP2436]|nr:hypothetical protein T492DRAFT_847156 [Pavlovales sp. CCMP2436]
MQIPLFVKEWGTTTADGQYGDDDGGMYVETAFSFLELMRDAESSTGVTISFAAEASAALVPGSCASQSWGATSCNGAFLHPEPLHDIANALALAIALALALALTLAVTVAVGLALALAIALTIALAIALTLALALAIALAPRHRHRPRSSPSPSSSASPAPSPSPVPTARSTMQFDYSTTTTWSGGLNGAVTASPVKGAQLMSSGKKCTLKLADYDALMVGFTAQGSVQAPTGMHCVGESSMPNPSPNPSPSPTPELQPCTRRLTEIELALSAPVSSLHQSLIAAIIAGSIGVVVGRLVAIRVAEQADKQPA